jgi:peptidoglycan hydrolase-like protein with peptidoglycan-binding domain
MDIRYRLLCLATGSLLVAVPALGQLGGAGPLDGQGPRQAQAGAAPITINSATVRRVQQALNQQGYDVGAADGQWSAGTADALRRYQLAQGLEPTGELNMRTLSALGVGSSDGAAQSTQAADAAAAASSSDGQ